MTDATAQPFTTTRRFGPWVTIATRRHPGWTSLRLEHAEEPNNRHQWVFPTWPQGKPAKEVLRATAIVLADPTCPIDFVHHDRMAARWSPLGWFVWLHGGTFMPNPEADQVMVFDDMGGRRTIRQYADRAIGLPLEDRKLLGNAKVHPIGLLPSERYRSTVWSAVFAALARGVSATKMLELREPELHHPAE